MSPDIVRCLLGEKNTDLGMPPPVLGPCLGLRAIGLCCGSLDALLCQSEWLFSGTGRKSSLVFVVIVFLFPPSDLLRSCGEGTITSEVMVVVATVAESGGGRVRGLEKGCWSILEVSCRFWK